MMRVGFERIIFVGDIHGCYDELQELLSEISFDPKADRLISLGDLMHKGDKSAEVIRFFMENNYEAIMGNHDYYFMQILQKDREHTDEYRKIKKELGMKRRDLLKWFKKRPKFVEGDDFIAVHAGVHPWQDSVAENDIETLYYTRVYDPETQEAFRSRNGQENAEDLVSWYRLLNEESYGGKKIIFGHWAKKKLVQKGNVYGLDTGCCYGGRLSALIYPSMEIVQVKSRQPKQFDY